MLAVDAEGDVRFVTRAKNPISFFSCGHGKPPPFPIPRLGVAARMRVRVGGLGGISETLMLCVAEFSIDVVLFGLVEERWSGIARRVWVLEKLRALRA